MKYFLDRKITLRRLRTEGNFQTYSATGTADGYWASFQEPQGEKQDMGGGQIGDMYECFVEDTCPAVDADQVVINSIIYSVRSVKYMDFGINKYKRLTVVKGGN